MTATIAVHRDGTHPDLATDRLVTYAQRTLMLTTVEATRTGSDVVADVHLLSTGFRERIPSTEMDRSVVRASIDELVSAGVARLLVPRAYGGLEQTVRSLVGVAAAAAYGCPSTGWLTGLMAHVPHVFALFPPEAQEAVWASGPDVVGAGTSVGLTVQVVEGGYRISGNSPFASGVNNAEWAYLGGMVPQSDGPPQLRFFLVDRTRFAVNRVWDTVAMRGTGSNVIVTDDVFVPNEHTLGATDAREGTGAGPQSHENPHYRLPWVATGSLIFAATMLGACRGAYDEALSAFGGKRAPNGKLVADSRTLQLDLGWASARIAAAESLILAAADRADTGNPYSTSDRAVASRTATFAGSLLVEAIDGLMKLSGTAGFAIGSFIQQAWRDVNFAAAHQGLNPRLTIGRFGLLELGADEPQKPFLY